MSFFFTAAARGKRSNFTGSMPIERISSSIFVAHLASYCKPILPVLR